MHLWMESFQIQRSAGRFWKEWQADKVRFQKLAMDTNSEDLSGEVLFIFFYSCWTWSSCWCLQEWTKVTSYRCYNPWNMQTSSLADLENPHFCTRAMRRLHFLQDSSAKCHISLLLPRIFGNQMESCCTLPDARARFDNSSQHLEEWHGCTYILWRLALNFGRTWLWRCK